MKASPELIEFLSNAAQSLAASHDISALATALHEITNQVVEVEYSALYLADPATGKLRLWIAKGFSEQERAEAERTAMDRHPGWIVRNKTLIHVPDVDEDPQNLTKDSARAFRLRSRLYIPVIARDECVGTVGLGSLTPRAFSEIHIETMRFVANLAGVMHQNIEHLRKLSNQLALIESQKEELLTLSAPLIEVDTGLLMVPVMGRFDEERARRVAERLLAAIVARGIAVVVLDLTGLETMDAVATEQIARIAAAASLLGCRSAVCGISPALARVTVDLGRDLGPLHVARTLKEALAWASGPRGGKARGR